MKINGQIIDGGFNSLKKEPHTHGGHAVPRIWVMVADRKVAHIYRKTADGLEKIADAKADGQKTSAMVDLIGENHSHIAKDSSDHHDPREQEHHEDMNFIHGLAGLLDQAVREDAMDRVLIVAAPRTLGNIRAALSRPVHARVMAEVSKELTKLNPKDLMEELTKIIWF